MGMVERALSKRERREGESSGWNLEEWKVVGESKGGNGFFVLMSNRKVRYRRGLMSWMEDEM